VGKPNLVQTFHRAGAIGVPNFSYIGRRQSAVTVSLRWGLHDVVHSWVDCRHFRLLAGYTQAKLASP